MSFSLVATVPNCLYIVVLYSRVACHDELLGHLVGDDIPRHYDVIRELFPNLPSTTKHPIQLDRQALSTCLA